MPRFRKRPVVIEARLFEGAESGRDIVEWMRGHGAVVYDPLPWYPQLVIATLEGNMAADWGDWIIRGVEDEFYPCKPEIFLKTYELVGEI